VAQGDLLRDVLELAGREKTLEGDGLEAFVGALRERAGLILEERVHRLEERVRVLERENSWRGETMAGLEESVRALDTENGWHRETVAGLQESVRALEDHGAWQRETVAGLETQVEMLAAERQKATGAHEHLLAHHRDVVRQVVGELAAVSSLSLLRVREARRRLAALAERLRPEAP
jgi:chromosome segregation ATPase